MSGRSLAIAAKSAPVHNKGDQQTEDPMCIQETDRGQLG